MQSSLLSVLALALLFSLTGCGGAPATPAAVTPAVKPATPTGPAAPATPPLLFPNAAWLHTAPTGAGLNISAVTASLGAGVNAHDGGFDYPVQYTDGSHGCTTFTDTLQYAFTDRLCVPNPADGYRPSFGGWGANDGHVVVVDTSTGSYYDFWKLSVDGNGQPRSTNVGRVVEGSLSGDGTPGTTAASVTGLAGDILPGELDCDTCLNHALNIIVPASMNSNQLGDQGPIEGTDGGVPGGVFREGAKIRFDPTIDVSRLQGSTAVKAILRALQLYGGLITDQTGAHSIGIYSALEHTPDQTGMGVLVQHLWIYY